MVPGLFPKRPEKKTYTKEEIEGFERKLKETPLEKNDLPALIIAGLITIIPVVVVFLIILYAILWLVFLR